MPNWVTIKAGSDRNSEPDNTGGGRWKTIKPPTIEPPMAAPQPAGTTGVFNNFISYVKKNSVEAAKGNALIQNPRANDIKGYQDITGAQKVAGAIATPAYAGRDLFNMFTEPEAKTGQYLGEGRYAHKYEEAVNQNVKTIMSFREIAKNGRTEMMRENAKKRIEELMEQNKELTAQAGGEISTKTTRQLAGLSLEVATDFATAGLETTISKLFTGKLAKKLITKPIRDIAMLGALYGTTNVMREEGEKSTMDYAKGAGKGAFLAHMFGKVVEKIGRKYSKTDVSDVTKTKKRIYDESVTGMKKQYEGAKITEAPSHKVIDSKAHRIKGDDEFNNALEIVSKAHHKKVVETKVSPSKVGFDGFQMSDFGTDVKSTKVLKAVKAGERKPIIAALDDAGNLVAKDGNHHLWAYKKLGVEDIPVIMPEDALSKFEVLSPKLIQGRVDDIAQKLEREVGEAQGKIFRNEMAGKQFLGYDDLAKSAKLVLKKIKGDSAKLAPIQDEISRVFIRAEQQKSNKIEDIFIGGNREVNLSDKMPIANKGSQGVTINVTNEPNVEKLIKDSGYVDYSVSERSSIETVSGGRAAGRARYDFDNDMGIIQVSSKATDKTKAHEFAHVANYKIGEKGEKFSTQLTQYNQGKAEIPQVLKDYAAKVKKDPRELTTQIMAGIKASARMEFSDAVTAAKNPSEEFSSAVANAILKENEVAKSHPEWVSFVKSEITRSAKPQRMDVPARKTPASPIREASRKEIEMQGKKSSAVREYVKSKTTKFRETKKSIARVVPTKRLELGGDFQRALGDVNVGRKPFSNLPILAVPTKRGTFVVKDGNTRLAQMMTRGAKKVEIITDEKAYRKLAQMEEDANIKSSKKSEAKKEVVKTHKRGKDDVREYVRNKRMSKAERKMSEKEKDRVFKTATFGGEKFRTRKSQEMERARVTTKILKKLEGRETVSKQFIMDLTNSGDVKQAERDMIREVLKKHGDKVNIKEFAKDVQAELLPLDSFSTDYVDMDGVNITNRELQEMMDAGVRPSIYESITLPSGKRGNVANYFERVYQSPIKTSAGNVHFSELARIGEADRYFGHTRVEDMSSSKNVKMLSGGKDSIRRVIEVQSDLYQKGNLEAEFSARQRRISPLTDESDLITKDRFGNTELKPKGETAKQIEIDRAKLQQYNNPSAHFRMVREEVNKAAEDGKTKLQFPTGRTAMDIEGLGDRNDWRIGEGANDSTGRNRFFVESNEMPILKESSLEIGTKINNGGGETWIITDVLGDGKFKAVPKKYANLIEEKMGQKLEQILKQPEQVRDELSGFIEQFDISGKVDTQNPIYRFYEKDLGKYLKNKYDAKIIEDANGVSWWEVDINPNMKGDVEAFRLKDDFEEATGIKITNKQESEILSLNKRIFGDENIKITPQILANKDALGSYRDGMIKIVGGQADAKDTFYHEAVHKYLDVFTSEDEQVKLLELAQKKYGLESIADVEEKLAEDFISYAKSREGLTGEMKLIVDKIINRVKAYFKNEDVIDTFYNSILTGKKEIVGETKRSIKVKTPSNVTSGGVVKKNIVPIKNVSVRLDKINSTDDVKELINKFSTMDKEVIDRQRRGRISEDELDELATFTGLKPSDVLNAKAGSIVNAENAMATRKMMATMASEIVDFTKTLPLKPDRSQLFQFKKMIDQYRGVQKALAGFRSEAGRLLKSFSYKAMPEEYDMYDDLMKAVAKIDQNEADSLQKAIKVGKVLKPDNLFQLAIKAGVDARNAFLLYSPPTHAANTLGGLWNTISAPLKKFIGEKISRWKGYDKGIVKGEAAAHMKGISDALPEAWQGLKQDFDDIFHAREMSGGLEKAKDIAREPTIYNFLRAIKVGEKSAMNAEHIIKTSFRLLTAGDKFFRMINFGGELYSQAIRKARHEGLSGDALLKRIEDLVDDPIADEDFFKAINNQVDISVFQEKSEALSKLIGLREKYPIAKIIVPFMQTPWNVAKEGIRTSPLGFARPTLAKLRGQDMEEAQKALAYAQASIGTVLAYVGLNYVAQGRITGSLPTDRNEKEEFYASGKQPYSVKIGDKWVSYRRMEPLAMVLSNTVNTYNTVMQQGKDADAKMVQVGSQFARAFMDQTFVRGIMDTYNAISDPEGSGKYYIKSMATSLFPSIIRHTTFSVDKTMRETDSVSEAIQSILPTESHKLPAKVDIFGNEVKRQGSTVELFLSPFKRSGNVDDPVVKELEKSDYNLTTFRLDEISGVKLEGKAREQWLKMVGQATKAELDKVVKTPRFQNMDQSQKDETLKEAVTKVRNRYRDQARAKLYMEFKKRKDMTKEEQAKYDEQELSGKLYERIMSMNSSL